MTTYYVGSGGDNANAGTSWALRKLTLNGAEDISLSAGDTVYVGPGTYRELLTCDASGSAGNPITYIGDYTGANTDGVGGVVRITGSDNDRTGGVRNQCIYATGKSYRTFRGFLLDSSNSSGNYVCDFVGGPTNIIVEQCAIQGLNNNGTNGIRFNGAAQAACSVSNCIFTPPINCAIQFYHSTQVDDCAHTVSNCIFYGGMNSYSIEVNYIGGVTVRNCFSINNFHVYSRNLTAGQTTTVNNCIFVSGTNGLTAGTAGMLTENYNSLVGINTARTNVSVGANSNTYLHLSDMRWFFELVSGGSMLSPFDLASYSQLLDVAGTSPTTADLRGTTVQGTQREWGALEYDSTLDIEAGSGGGFPILGGSVVR